MAARLSISISGLAGLSLLLTAAGASAQEAPPQQARAPTVAPASASASASALERMQTVRIHAHSVGKLEGVRIETGGTDAQPHIVCVSEPPMRKPGGARNPFRDKIWGDCIADVAPGSQLRITLGDSKEGHIYGVPDDPGSELDLKVLSAERTAEKASGAVLIGVGGIGVFVGSVVIPIVGTFRSLSSGAPWATTSLIVIASGAAIVVVGVLVFVSGSREPLVESKTTYRAATWDGREDTVLGDVASARPRDRSATLPTITPLSYSLTF